MGGRGGNDDVQDSGYPLFPVSKTKRCCVAGILSTAFLLDNKYSNIILTKITYYYSSHAQRTEKYLATYVGRYHLRPALEVPAYLQSRLNWGRDELDYVLLVRSKLLKFAISTSGSGLTVWSC